MVVPGDRRRAKVVLLFRGEYNHGRLFRKAGCRLSPRVLVRNRFRLWRLFVIYILRRYYYRDIYMQRNEHLGDTEPFPVAHLGRSCAAVGPSVTPPLSNLLRNDQIQSRNVTA